MVARERRTMTAHHPQHMKDIGTAQDIFEILSKPVPPNDEEAKTIIEWMGSRENVSLYVDVALIEASLRGAGLAEPDIGERWIAAAPDARKRSVAAAASLRFRLAA